MMDRGQDWPLVDEWLGQVVFIKYMGTKPLSDDELESLGDDPDSVFHGSPRAMVDYVFLERYDQFGIGVRDRGEESLQYFLPWGAVLNIVPVEDAEEPGPEPAVQGQTEQVEDRPAEEAAPPHDRRQELMDRLANAQTATEVAVARGAADAWLAANPSDGDVRMALDRLPDPSGD
jgi:hypothetical protein